MRLPSDHITEMIDLDGIGLDSIDPRISYDMKLSTTVPNKVKCKYSENEDNASIFSDFFNIEGSFDETTDVPNIASSVCMFEETSCLQDGIETRSPTSNETKYQSATPLSDEFETNAAGMTFNYMTTDINPTPAVDINPSVIVREIMSTSCDKAFSNERNMVDITKEVQPSKIQYEHMNFNSCILDGFEISNEHDKTRNGNNNNNKQRLLFNDIDIEPSKGFSLQLPWTELRSQTVTSQQACNVVPMKKGFERHQPGGIYVCGKLMHIEAKKKRQGNKCGLPQPSRFCHICLRRAEKVTMVACGRLRSGGCRKVVCEKCFVEHGWDWNGATKLSGYWECTHCQQRYVVFCCFKYDNAVDISKLSNIVLILYMILFNESCPERAQCFIYKRTNHRRHEALMMRKRSQINEDVRRYGFDEHEQWP